MGDRRSEDGALFQNSTYTISSRPAGYGTFSEAYPTPRFITQVLDKPLKIGYLIHSLIVIFLLTDETNVMFRKGAIALRTWFLAKGFPARRGNDLTREFDKTVSIRAIQD